MKKEELYETIEGIDEKFVNEAENASITHKTPRWLRVTVAACLCLCLCCTVPVFAFAGNEFAYDVLYSLTPSVAQKLKPVNISCEDNGIEMTVIAAEIAGEKATVLVSMCDKVGNRLDETTDLFDSYSIHTPYDQSGSCFLVSYDDAAKTATFMITIEQLNHVLIPGDKITFSVNRLISKKEHSMFRLTQIGTENLQPVAELITGPDFRGQGGMAYQSVDWNNQQLVKPDEANAVSLKSGVTLTGYGLIDGKLHIQLRYDDIRNTDNHGYVYLRDYNGEANYGEAVCSFWDENRINSYEEYIFPVTAEELADYEIWGEFWTCNSGPIDGSWQLTFPLSVTE